MPSIQGKITVLILKDGNKRWRADLEISLRSRIRLNYSTLVTENSLAAFGNIRKSYNSTLKELFTLNHFELIENLLYKSLDKFYLSIFLSYIYVWLNF